VTTDNDLQSQKSKIATHLLNFETLVKQFSEMQTECTDSAKAYKNKLADMSYERENKVH
jgi:hypothetical protein